MFGNTAAILGEIQCVWRKIISDRLAYIINKFFNQLMSDLLYIILRIFFLYYIDELQMTKSKRQALEDKLQGNVRFHEFNH